MLFYGSPRLLPLTMRLIIHALILGRAFAQQQDEDDICDYYSDDYDYDQCQILQNKCKTIDGKPCIFPFTFRSQEVTNCISGQRRKQPWCPTEVDSNGDPVPGQWGECNDQCPTEGADVGTPTTSTTSTITTSGTITSTSTSTRTPTTSTTSTITTSGTITSTSTSTRYGYPYTQIDDMILNADQEADYPGLDQMKYRWINGIIPFKISKQSFDELELDDELDEELERENILDRINDAIEELNDELCIDIREATQADTDQVNIVKGSDTNGGCSSYVGRKGGIQELTLGSSCFFSKYMIKHLFMHAIGFYHEQNRPDRGENVEILWDNIQEANTPFFEQRNSMETFGAYDCNSIMHYPYNAFVNQSKGSGPTKTIKPLNVDPIECGERFKSARALPSADLTTTDTYKVAKMYEGQKLQCKEYVTAQNIFNPDEEYKKYEQLIHGEECGWLCYSRDFQDLANCVDDVFNNDGFAQGIWTEECSEKAQQCLDECHPTMEKIEEALRARHPGDRKLRKVKRDLRNMAKHNFESVDYENLDIIKYCHNERNVPKLWFLKPITRTQEAREICTDDNSDLGGHITKLCLHYWVSVPIRASFYYQCLQNFNIGTFVKKGQYSIRSLRDISIELRDMEKDNAFKKIGAGASLIGGGLATGLGIILAPFTAGGSLALTYIGGAASLGGGLTGIVPDKSLVQSIEEAQQASVDLINIDGKKLERVMQLYTLSANYLENFTYSQDLRDKQYEVIRELGHIVPTIKGLTVGAKAMGINKFSASMFGKLKGSVLRHSKIMNSYRAISRTFKAITSGFSRGFKPWTQSKLGKALAGISVKSVISKIIPFIDIGLGIWDVLRGDKELKGGMSHEIRASAKTLSYQVDVMVGAYTELMGEDFEMSNLSVEESLYSIHIITGNKTTKTKLKIELKNDLATSCSTNRFKTWNSNSDSWSGDTTILYKRQELGDCGRLMIKNDTKIRYINYGSTLINKISIGTNGRSVPSWTCDFADVSLPAYGAKSQWVSCEQTKVLSKIKFHTANDDGSGTDASKKVTFRVIKGKKNVRFQNNTSDCKHGKCDHCADSCRYVEGDTSYDYTWCYTTAGNSNWDYCQLDPDFDFQKEQHPIKTKNGHECDIPNSKFCGYHGKTKTWCYYDQYLNWDYCKIPAKVTALATESLYECKTWTLDNVGNDAERGQTDIYHGKMLGTCSQEDLLDMEEDVKEHYTLQVDIEKYGAFGDMWKPDLLKLYWQNVGTMTCNICNDCTDGYGVPLPSGIFHFECSILNPLRTGIESIEIKGCQDYENLESGDQTKLRICKSEQGFKDSFDQSKEYDGYECCSTNKFVIQYDDTNLAKIDGNTAHDDGGEQLGQCEGFDLKGSSLYTIGVEYDHSYGFCMNSLRFLGGSSISLDENIPFAACNFPDVTFDNNEVHHNKNRDWKNWKDSPFKCNLGNKNATKIQTIHAKVCHLENSGSEKQIKAIFQVGEGKKIQTCEQDLAGEYFKGNYKSTAVTNCAGINVGSDELKMWIINPAQVDAICLEDIYVDVSSEGKSKILRCSLNQKEMWFRDGNRTEAGAPLSCI